MAQACAKPEMRGPSGARAPAAPAGWSEQADAYVPLSKRMDLAAEVFKADAAMRKLMKRPDVEDVLKGMKRPAIECSGIKRQGPWNASVERMRAAEERRRGGVDNRPLPSWNFRFGSGGGGDGGFSLPSLNSAPSSGPSRRAHGPHEHEKAQSTQRQGGSRSRSQEAPATPSAKPPVLPASASAPRLPAVGEHAGSRRRRPEASAEATAKPPVLKTSASAPQLPALDGRPRETSGSRRRRPEALAEEAIGGGAEAASKSHHRRERGQSSQQPNSDRHRSPHTSVPASATSSEGGPKEEPSRGYHHLLPTKSSSLKNCARPFRSGTKSNHRGIRAAVEAASVPPAVEEEAEVQEPTTNPEVFEGDAAVPTREQTSGANELVKRHSSNDGSSRRTPSIASSTTACSSGPGSGSCPSVASTPRPRRSDATIPDSEASALEAQRAGTVSPSALSEELMDESPPSAQRPRPEQQEAAALRIQAFQRGAAARRKLRLMPSRQQQLESEFADAAEAEEAAAHAGGEASPKGFWQRLAEKAEHAGPGSGEEPTDECTEEVAIPSIAILGGEATPGTSSSASPRAVETIDESVFSQAADTRESEDVPMTRPDEAHRPAVEASRGSPLARPVVADAEKADAAWQTASVVIQDDADDDYEGFEESLTDAPEAGAPWEAGSPAGVSAAVAVASDGDTKTESAPAEPAAATAEDAVLHECPPAGLKAAEVPLNIGIIGARGLQGSDWFSKADPYCVCEVNGLPVVRTDVASNDPNPTWNHSAQLDSFLLSDSLVFKVYDKDILRDDLLGTVTLAVDSFHPGGFEGDVPLHDAKAGAQAYLTLKIAPVAPVASAASYPSDSEHEQLSSGSPKATRPQSACPSTNSFGEKTSRSSRSSGSSRSSSSSATSAEAKSAASASDSRPNSSSSASSEEHYSDDDFEPEEGDWSLESSTLP